MEFLGSKRALEAFLINRIAPHCRKRTRVLDLFCGTATISGALSKHGCHVTANDHLRLCSTFAEATLLFDPRNAFAEIESKGYQGILHTMNALPGEQGFIYQNYTPAGGRMYLTQENGARVDAIRRRIREHDSQLTRGERARLLVDLVTAVTLVSNTAGTYGCYLKRWKARALQPLTLVPTRPVPVSEGHNVYCLDAEEVAQQVSSDVVYADPPYTKRQYAAYYHLLETIVEGDTPELIGTTGLRPWRDRSSDWCYRRRAADALRRLLSKLQCHQFFLSYSEDGQITDEAIRDILRSHGQLTVHSTTYRRYRSSSLHHRGPALQERLYHLALA